MLYEEPLKDERSRCRAQLKFNNGIRDRGLRLRICLGSEMLFKKKVGQTFGLEIVKCTIGSFVKIRKRVLRYCGGAANRPTKEETVSSLRAIDETTLGTFALTYQKKYDGGTPGPAHTLSEGLSGRAALRREQREQLERTEPR
jgi:hypothetical protein